MDMEPEESDAAEAAHEAAESDAEKMCELMKDACEQAVTKTDHLGQHPMMTGMGKMRK